MRMLQQRNGRVKYRELWFFITYTCYIILTMYGTTMFMEHLQVSSVAYTLCRFGLLLSLSGLIITNSLKYTKKKLTAILVLGTLIIYIACTTQYTILIDTYLLCICASEISISKICKVYCCTAGLFGVITVLASAVGIIQNLTFTVDSHVRNSFGFIYPTDFAAHCFYFWLAYMGIKKRSFKFKELIISICISIFLYFACYAKLNAVLFCVGGILFWITDKNFKWLYQKMIKKIIIYVFPILFLASVLSAVFYTDNFIWTNLDNLFTHRLSSGHDAYMQYGLSVFGQYIKQQGYGWSVGGFDADFGYFFIDNGYLKLLLCYGVLLAVVVTVSSVIVMKRFYQRRNHNMILILLLIAISNFIDGRFLEIAYSSYFMLYLCPCLYIKYNIHQYALER